MPETLTPFQIQLLLYYLEAEPKKRTVTDSARILGTTKWAVTRALDALEKQDVVERQENRPDRIREKAGGEMPRPNENPGAVYAVSGHPACADQRERPAGAVGRIL